MKDAVYSIKDLEVLSGVKAHTIRIWEKRYQLLTPNRSKTNIRSYCDEDLRRLLNIALLTRQGIRISRLTELSCDQIKDEIIALKKNRKDDSHDIDRLIIHMVNFDDNSFLKLFDEVIRLKGMEEAISNVIFPFFEKIGTYWQVGSIFPAQEHFVSNLVRQKIIAEINQFYGKSSQNKTILFFLHEKEMHEIGLLFYTLMALRRGFKVIYLGQFVPLKDLHKIKGKNEIDYVFTLFVNSIMKKDFQEYLDSLSKIFPDKKIFISGRQIQNHRPKLPANMRILNSIQDFNKYFKNI